MRLEFKITQAASEDVPPLRIAERAALQVAISLGGQNLLFTSIGRGQAAIEFWKSRPEATICQWFLDQYDQRQAQQFFDAAASEPNAPLASDSTRMSIVCAPDLPDQVFDLAMLPCTIRGEAELHRELLQQAYQRLAQGGQLVSAVDHPDDRWLHQQMKTFGEKVSVHHESDAVIYVLTKHGALKRPRSFTSRFSFRDRSRNVQLVTRPGVFSHRQVDEGALALLQTIEVAGHQRIIDIGCGSGAVGCALAGRADEMILHAIDGNARAVECALETAKANGLTRVTAELTCDGHLSDEGSFDIAACNPPYYSHFRIATLFVDTSRRALKPGGVAYFVTKQPEWYRENLYPGWTQIEARQVKKYWVVSAVRSGSGHGS